MTSRASAGTEARVGSPNQRGDAEGHEAADDRHHDQRREQRQRRIDEWRDSCARLIVRLQDAKVLRADLEPTDVLRSLGALALGAETRLLGNASPSAVEQELPMLDGFVDALAGPSALRALG